MTKKIILSFIIATAIGASYVAFDFYQKIFSSNTAAENVLYIGSKDSFENVVANISPLLLDSNSFIWVAKRKNYPNTVKPGKYIIPQNINNNDLVNLLRSGKQEVVKLSFNNQDTLEKLAGRISQQIEADSISLLKAFSDRYFLTKNNITKENALAIYIPNTYQFYWNTSAENFRDRMHTEFEKFWTKNKITLAKKQKLTVFEAITIASIVQKETATTSERPTVAGLYLNRYKNGWPLQADPTVIFALKQELGQDAVIKRVLLNDLKIDSKYNTYKYKNLPPGLISMPDISSVNAVLNPELHDYFYMCADIENPGKHVFAKTLQQHNKNAIKYQQWIDRQGITR